MAATANPLPQNHYWISTTRDPLMHIRSRSSPPAFPVPARRYSSPPPLAAAAAIGRFPAAVAAGSQHKRHRWSRALRRTARRGGGECGVTAQRRCTLHCGGRQRGRRAAMSGAREGRSSGAASRVSIRRVAVGSAGCGAERVVGGGGGMRDGCLLRSLGSRVLHPANGFTFQSPCALKSPPSLSL